jgi:DNA-binding GntR family transcriptional regulator
MKQQEPAKKDHRDLLSIARKRDVEGGCALLTAHIERTKVELLRLVAENRAQEGG